MSQDLLSLYVVRASMTASDDRVLEGFNVPPLWFCEEPKWGRWCTQQDISQSIHYQKQKYYWQFLCKVLFTHPFWYWQSRNSGWIFWIANDVAWAGITRPLPTALATAAMFTMSLALGLPKNYVESILFCNVTRRSARSWFQTWITPSEKGLTSRNIPSKNPSPESNWKMNLKC